jgi:MFS family permease
MSFGLRLAPHHRVFGGFAIYSFGLANIFPRLPDIKAAMGVQEGALGLGLIGTPVGTLIALTFAGPLIERIGFRRVLLAAIPLMAFGLALAAHAPDPLTFFLMLIPVGLMIGSAEVILNVEADRVEHLVGFRIMNRAHSFWSIGFFGAGLFGAAMAQLGLSTGLHLALVVPLTTLGVALILGGYQPAPKRAEEAEHIAPRFARPTGAILVLVAVTLSAMLLEGASLDWSAIYMRNVFDSGPFLSGIAVAIFAFCQAAARFFADSFVDRHSPSGVARVLLCIMAVGVFLVFLGGWPALSLLGFALIGVGCSAIFPLAV